VRIEDEQLLHSEHVVERGTVLVVLRDVVAHDLQREARPNARLPDLPWTNRDVRIDTGQHVDGA